MAAPAPGAGRLRALLAEAQALVSEVRSLPLDLDSCRRCYPALFRATCAVKRFQDAISASADDVSRPMWEQRGMWLQEETSALMSERIHSSDTPTQWLNLLLLLYAAASVVESSEEEKAELHSELQHCHVRCAELERHVAEGEERVRAAAQNAVLSPAAVEETLALQSALTVANQRAASAADECSELTAQVQALLAEQAALISALDASRSRLPEVEELAERRLEVIQTMMVHNEEASSRTASLTSENAGLTKHCATLAANLESHAAVIEKLVMLNTELMDTLNTRSSNIEYQKSSSTPAPTAAHTVAMNGSHVGPPPSMKTLGHPEAPSSRASDRPLNPAQHHGPVLNHPASLPRQPSSAALTIVPPLAQDGTSASAPPVAPGSLSDAFQAFLLEPESPNRATAASLAAPPSSNHTHNHERSVWSRAAGLVGLAGNRDGSAHRQGTLEVVQNKGQMETPESR